MDNILGRPGKSTASSCTRPSIICSSSSNAANVSEPCYMSACSTHSSFASPLEREWGKPCQRIRQLRGELSEVLPFLLDCILAWNFIFLATETGIVEGSLKK